MSKRPTLKKWEKRRGVAWLRPGEVTVDRHRNLSIHRESVESRFGGGYAVLHYDDELKIVALEPQTSENPDAYKLKPASGEGSRTWRVTARALMRHLRVKPGRYEASWDDGLGVLMFEYEEEAEAG